MYKRGPRMSLLDVWATHAEAIMAVDSDGVGTDGDRLPASKLLPIPHLNAALGLRGQLAFLQLIFLRVLSLGFETFDDLADFMPAILAEADSLTPAGLIVDAHGALAGNELVACGWSHRHKRMVALQCVKHGDMPAFFVQGVDRHVSPWHASMQGIRIAPQAVDKLARAQVSWMRETFPNAACGGKLIVCRLTRNAMTLRHEFTFQPQVQEIAA